MVFEDAVLGVEIADVGHVLVQAKLVVLARLEDGGLERPEVAREVELALVVELLIGEDQHGILGEGGANGGEIVGGERLAEHDVAHFGGEVRGDRMDGDGHGARSWGFVLILACRHWTTERTFRQSADMMAGMIEKQEVQEIFPTPLWIVDLQPAAAASLNAKLKAEIERLIEPRPKIPAGSNWQTPQDLHTKPAFAEFVKLVETAARGVTRFLQVDQYPMGITGCWANVNPPGAYHPMHHHPNNYLSGVYYVAVPTAGSQIIFQDPRGQASMIMPKPKQYTRLTANGANAQSKEGRLLIFPAWLKHTVPANDGQSERISISFNLMFKNFSETMAAPLWDATAGKEKS